MDSENISAVVVNPQGTLLKFNRLGHIAGFGDPRVRMVRRALIRHDGGSDPRPSLEQEDVGGPDYRESWVEGVVVLHNHRARIPLDPGLLPGATHEFLQQDRRIMSLLPERPVYFSNTFIKLGGDAGPASEEEAVAGAT